MKRVPMPSSRARGWRRKSSVTGTAEISFSACTCRKAGVSMMLSRIHAPIASSSTLTRKHARQPQARKASSGSRLARANAPEARNRPPGTPMWAKLPKKPRRSAGANSTASSTAPPYSPPTPMPWRTRSATSSTGAQTPISSYVGSRPISAVPAPMMTSVQISIVLRPIRSPKWPKISPPTGRARKPTANVPNDANCAAGPSRPLKNSLSKTSPAEVP